jgi:magnesium-transporting ATPase (P-type)
LSQKNQANQSAAIAGIIGQIGCLTVIIITIALIAGLYLDRFLDTGRLFTLLFVVGSVPITLYVTVRVSLTAVSRLQQSKSTGNTEENHTT